MPYVEYTMPLRLTCIAFVKVDTYQWYLNGSLVQSPIANMNRYVKNSAQLNDSGVYQCRACNWAGCNNSSSYTVRVTGLYLFILYSHIALSCVKNVVYT